MRVPFALWLPSSKFNTGRTQKITRLVNHITDGAEKSAESAARNFVETKRSVSAHFVVGRKIEEPSLIVQLVDTDNTAWHAKGTNANSIGIEHPARAPGELGKSDPGVYPTIVQYAASSYLAWYLCIAHSINPDREHVLGHKEAAPNSTHNDCPNAVWNWDLYMELLQGLFTSQKEFSFLEYVNYVATSERFRTSESSSNSTHNKDS